MINKQPEPTEELPQHPDTDYVIKVFNHLLEDRNLKNSFNVLNFGENPKIQSGKR